MGEKFVRQFYQNSDFHVNLGIFYMPRNLRHGTDGFTSPPKEGVLRKFCLKNPTVSAGFEPANLGSKGQYSTPRIHKPITFFYIQ